MPKNPTWRGRFAPQCGQDRAVVLTSFPHSLHALIANFPTSYVIHFTAALRLLYDPVLAEILEFDHWAPFALDGSSWSMAIALAMRNIERRPSALMVRIKRATSAMSDSGIESIDALFP